MVNGQWSMVDGQWSMVNDRWSMVGEADEAALVLHQAAQHAH
jgi:hypothetical protein